MKKSKKKLYIRIVLFLLIISMCFFYKTLFHKEIFAWYNDQLFQHNVFYKEWYRIIRESISNHTLAVYSWNTFLGTDYLASKLMYCVGDFLITPFFIMYNGEINFDKLFAVTTIICIVLSGINMSIYLNKINIKKDWLLLSLPIVYALGGFAMTYTGSYMFHRFYTLLPLLFYFCERYLKDKKLIGFSLITALLFLQSYELLFSTCFFLILYFIISCKLKEVISFKEIIKKAIPVVASLLIGIALCGFVLIPLIIYIKSNPRVGSLNFDSIIWDFRTIVGFITNEIIPSFNFRSGIPNYLFYTGDHYSSEYGLFCTAIFILAFVQLNKKGTKPEKRCLFIGETIIVLCLLIKPINMIIHGLSVPNLRWSFLLEIYHIFVIAYVFNKYDYDVSCAKEVSIIFVIYIALYVAFAFVNKINISDYLMSLVINVGSFLLIYLYDLLLTKRMNSVLCGLIIVNMISMYALSIFATYGIYGKEEKSYNIEYLNYIIDTDEDKMSRFYFKSDELWPYSWLNLNDSINNDYLGVTTYDSTYESALADFLSDNGFDSWMIDINNPKLLEMLGVKYVATTDSNSVNKYDCEMISTLDNFNVYQLNIHNSIGYTLNNYVKESNTNKVNWGNELVIKDEDYDKINDFLSYDKSQLHVIEYSRQYLRGSINIKGDSVLFIATPYSTGWNVIDQDGRKLETIDVNKGFLGIIVDDNVEEISMYYGTPGLKAGIVISFISVVSLAMMFYWERKNEKKI